MSVTLQANQIHETPDLMANTTLTILETASIYL